MPLRLVSPPITPRDKRPCAQKRKASSSGRSISTTKKRKASSIASTSKTESDFVRTSSPSQSPVKWHFNRKLASPPKKRRTLSYTSGGADSGAIKGKIRNLRPLQNALSHPGEVEDISRRVLGDAGEIVRGEAPKMTAEETYRLVEQFKVRGRVEGEGTVKGLLAALENVVRGYLETKVKEEDHTVGRTTEFFVLEWRSYTKKTALLCSLFSPLETTVDPLLMLTSNSPPSPTIKDRLLNVFGSQLSQQKSVLFSEITKKLDELRDNGSLDAGSLEVGDVLCSVRDMLTQTNCELYRELCLVLSRSLATYYGERFVEQAHGSPVELLTYLIKVVSYEEQLTRLILSDSVAEEFRHILTRLASTHFEEITTTLAGVWTVNWDVFSSFSQQCKPFLNDRNLSQPLLTLCRMYWCGRMKPLLQSSETHRGTPEKLLKLTALFDVWKEDVGVVSVKVKEAVMLMLSEAVRVCLPDTAQIQVLMGAFAQLVAKHAWKEGCSTNTQEVQSIVEYLKLFKEIDAFESSLRSVTVNYFVQSKTPDDYQSAYIKCLQDSLDACFSIDWTAFNSILVELELSQSLSAEFHNLQWEAQPDVPDYFTVSLLKSSSVGNCFTPVTLNMPREIALAAQDFHAFYTQHAKKKLSFVSGVGSCTLVGHGVAVGGNVVIKSTLPQAVVLLAFAWGEELSFGELQFRTGLTVKSLLEELMVLSELVGVVESSAGGTVEGAVVEQDDVVYGLRKSLIKHRRLSFLSGFKRNVTVAVTPASTARSQVGKSLLDRKQQMDSVIVRVMKAERCLALDALLKRLPPTLSSVKIEDLKSHVDSLVSREFLCWKAGSYHQVLEYLP